MVARLRGHDRSFCHVQSLILLSFGLSNCGPLAGRKILDVDRNYYNKEIVKSDDSQLLLNIVRLRHVDNVTFLQINNITAQKSIQSSGSGTWSVSPGAGYSLSNFLAGAFSYSDTPTIFFTPLQGSDFVNNLVITVSLKSLYHLINTAWNIEVILRLAVHQFNDDYNELGFIAREKDKLPHGYASFVRIVHLMRALQENDALKLSLTQTADKEPQLYFIFNKTRGLSTCAELKHLLHISPNASYMIWTNRIQKHMSPNTVYVRTRSVIQMMSFLANAIVLPQNVSTIKGFYPARIPGLIIYSSTVPISASIQTSYKGNYYYIRDDDSSSKRFFILFSSFYQLTAGLAGGINGVALTLPVGK